MVDVKENEYIREQKSKIEKIGSYTPIHPDTAKRILGKWKNIIFSYQEQLLSPKNFGWALLRYKDTMINSFKQNLDYYNISPDFNNTSVKQLIKESCYIILLAEFIEKYYRSLTSKKDIERISRKKQKIENNLEVLFNNITNSKTQKKSSRNNEAFFTLDIIHFALRKNYEQIEQNFTHLDEHILKQLPSYLGFIYDSIKKMDVDDYLEQFGDGKIISFRSNMEGNLNSFQDAYKESFTKCIGNPYKHDQLFHCYKASMLKMFKANSEHYKNIEID